MGTNRIPSVQVIDRYTCTGQTKAGADCTGLELYRMVFEDGTQKTLIAVPMPGLIDTSTSNWKQEPIKMMPVAGLQVTPAK